MICIVQRCSMKPHCLPFSKPSEPQGIGPPLNFEKPVWLLRPKSMSSKAQLFHCEVHSFDMFSLGVLALHLTIGRTEAWTGFFLLSGLRVGEWHEARLRLSAMESAGAGKDLTAVEAMAIVELLMILMLKKNGCKMAGLE